MKKKFRFFIVLLFTLNLTCLSLAQYEPHEQTQKITLKPSLGFEYSSRTINWEEKKYHSKLKSYLIYLSMGVEIQEGFLLNVIVGYNSSNYEGMTFRQLPFSIELGDKALGGFLFGGGIEKTIISHEDFEISLLGQFFYSIGFKKEWTITTLNVDGTVESKYNWIEAFIGPVFKYTGFDYFFPYLFVNFTTLRGTFKANEIVQDLEGSENKKFSGDGNFGVSTGFIYEMSESFNLKGETSFIPFRDGVDFGFMVKASYSF